MGKGFRIAVILIFLAIAAMAAVLLYPDYQAQRVAKEKSVVSGKSAELERLISSSEHDCDKVISLAKEFLAAHKTAAEIWHLKGVCEYYNGEFDSAKASFQKVLALNPAHEAAKSYLGKLDFKPGEVVLAPRELPFAREAFESRIGLKLNSLQLDKARRRPSNIPEYLSAVYSSTDSYKETVAYLKGELETAGFNYSESETAEGTVFLVFNLPKEQRFFTVRKTGSPTKIMINYLKHE